MIKKNWEGGQLPQNVPRWDTLRIQSPPENGSATELPCWGGDFTPQSSSDKVIGSLGIVRRVICFFFGYFFYFKYFVPWDSSPWKPTIWEHICFTDFPSIVTKQIQGMLSSIMWKPSIWILRFLDAQGWGVSHVDVFAENGSTWRIIPGSFSG